MRQLGAPEAVRSRHRMSKEGLKLVEIQEEALLAQEQASQLVLPQLLWVQTLKVVSLTRLVEEHYMDFDLLQA